MTLGADGYHAAPSPRRISAWRRATRATPGATGRHASGLSSAEQSRSSRFIGGSSAGNSPVPSDLHACGRRGPDVRFPHTDHPPACGRRTRDPRAAIGRAPTAPVRASRPATSLAARTSAHRHRTRHARRRHHARRRRPGPSRLRRRGEGARLTVDERPSHLRAGRDRPDTERVPHRIRGLEAATVIRNRADPGRLSRAPLTQPRLRRPGRVTGHSRPRVGEEIRNRCVKTSGGRISSLRRGPVHCRAARRRARPRGEAADHGRNGASRPRGPHQFLSSSIRMRLLMPNVPF